MRLIPALVFLCFLFAGPAQAAGDAIFHQGVPAIGSLKRFPQWNALVQKLHARGDDTPLRKARRVNVASPADDALPPPSCDNACARKRWTTFLEGLRGMPWLEQLEAVNRWANAKPYVEDWMNWGVSDYWETPEEFVRRGGDCEDYAIAKYYSLLRLGFAPSDLRIVIVHDRNLDASHALLAVRREGRSWLLDITVDDVVPLAKVPQYIPVYALGQNDWWLYPPPSFAASRALQH